MLISKEALLKRLEDRPPDAMIPVAAVRQMIYAEQQDDEEVKRVCFEIYDKQLAEKLLNGNYAPIDHSFIEGWEKKIRKYKAKEQKDD